MESNSDKSLDDSEHQLTFLPSPQYKKLTYLEKSVSLYANLYKIVINKSNLFYEYSIKFNEGDIEKTLSTKMKHKILRKITKDLTERFGAFILAGDVLFSAKKVTDVTNKVIQMNQYNYSVIFFLTKNSVQLSNDKNVMKDMYLKKPEVKTILEVIVKEVLKHNPSLKFAKNLYGKKSEEKIINAYEDYNQIKVMPGFTTSVLFLDEGIFLNVDIKSKITSSYDCLYLINTFIDKKGQPTEKEIKEINDFFSQRYVETNHTAQRFQVEMVNFDKRAKNFEMKFENKSIPITKFYKSIFDIEIDPNSPLLLVKSKGEKGQCAGRYYPPQVCSLIGLSDDMLKDSNLMKSVVREIKMSPDDRVTSIRDILKLVNEKRGIIKKKKAIDGSFVEETLASPYQKKIEFGIDIIEVACNNGFDGHIIKNPKIISAKNKVVASLSKPFEVFEAKKINYLCVYHKLHDKEKKQICDLLPKAGAAYGMLFGKSSFLCIDSDNPEDWIKKIDKVNDTSINVVIVIIDDYLASYGLYNTLKTHSLEEKGYITQVISTKSLFKNVMSVFSNILLQINTKIGGISYKIQFDEEIIRKNLMIIGVNTSVINIGGKRKLYMAVCSTINKSFTRYTQKKLEMGDEINGSSSLPLHNCIIDSLTEYFKENKTFPGGIIIYRQGVSKEQKALLENEVKQIDAVLKGETEILKKINIPYYYILVNKKSTLKLFECENSGKAGRVSRKDNASYDNPDSGLLVYKHIVDPQIFEFYIQPQKVNSGSATPSNFHVAYGNMNAPELIPKLTFDLCFLYSNWRGPVRVPAPLKYAEKLSKVDQNVKKNIKNTLAFI